MENPDPDLALIQQIAGGSASALEQLYQQYGLQLLNFLTTQLGDRPHAEEILQDVMLAVWKGAGQFRGESAVRTWLFAITQRQLSKARRGQHPADEMIDDEFTAIPIFDQSAHREWIQDALGQLPSIQQQAIELVFYQGLSGQEAADQLRIPLNTLKSHLYRARNTLRLVLDEKEMT